MNTEFLLLFGFQLLFVITLYIIASLIKAFLPQQFKQACKDMLDRIEAKLTGWTGAAIGVMLIIIAVLVASAFMAIGYAGFLWITA